MTPYDEAAGPEQESGGTAEPEAVPYGGLRLAWQRWRRTRPFWGGLFIIVGGGEMLVSVRAPLPVVVHVGLQGLAGYLVPAVLVLCGVLLWVNPVQQTFYSIFALLLSLGSWITSNLGGFFVGMLLGVVGGSLAFAWSRGAEPEPARPVRPRRPGQAPSAGLSLILGDEDPPVPQRRAARGGADSGVSSRDGKRESTDGNGGMRGGTAPNGSRLLAISAVPVVLAVLVALPRPGPAAGSPRVRMLTDVALSPGPALTVEPGPSSGLTGTPGEITSRPTVNVLACTTYNLGETRLRLAVAATADAPRAGRLQRSTVRGRAVASGTEGQRESILRVAVVPERLASPDAENRRGRRFDGHSGPVAIGSAPQPVTISGRVVRTAARTDCADRPLS